jgi:hypothetical protein
LCVAIIYCAKHSTSVLVSPQMATSVDAATKDSLLRQIEYYFSDIAFPYDEFLLGQRDADGAIPALILAGSPRIVSMMSTLTPEERAGVVVEVLARSEDVRVLEQDRLVRVWPLPMEDPKAGHSVYLSGAPKDMDAAALTAMMSNSPLAESFGPIVSIRRLRDVQKDREYSGQVFVECEDDTKALALVAAANKNKAGVEVNKAKLLSHFFEKQHQVIVEQKEKRAAKAEKKAAGGAKRPREEGAGSAAPQAPALSEEELKAQREADRAVLVRVEQVGATADRELLEKLCNPHGKVAFVDFSRGEPDGTIRFADADGATAALAALCAEGPDVGGAVAIWRQPTPEESESYWQKYRERRAQQQQQNKRGRGGGRGYGRGKGGRAYGRR